MTTKIEVSIIIPYFKKKLFFEKTIRSIIKQNFQKFEIIVIYDDENLNELSFVEKTLKNIKLKKIIINKKNLGPGLSRNRGISIAKGNFIAFCDADDLWNANKLSLQISYMKKNKLNFSHTSYSIINEKSKKIRKFIINGKITFQDLMKSCDIGLSTVIVKKIIFKEYLFCKLKTKEDYLLWLKIIKKIDYIYGLKKELSSWRVVNGSLSSSFFQKIMDSYRLYYIHEKYNIFISTFYVIRLSFWALLKKIKMYRNN